MKKNSRTFRRLLRRRISLSRNNSSKSHPTRWKTRERYRTCRASVKGEGFAVDASVMEANASRCHGKAPYEIAWAERVQFGYGLNHLIDIENAIIVDVEPTPARTCDEVEATNTMLDLRRYRASKFDCDVCALKMLCCPNMSARQIPRDLQDDARNVARGQMCTKALLKSRDERKRVSPEDPSRLRTHAIQRPFW